MYLVVIDESSGQVTETRKAQRGSWATPSHPSRTVQRASGACVRRRYPRCNPHRSHQRDPPFAHARRASPPLRPPGTSTLPVAHSAKREFPLGAAPPLAQHSSFRSSTASSTSRLVERPFDARPVNRFISRGIFAPFLRAPPLPACLSERTYERANAWRYDKAPKFSRSRETHLGLFVAPPPAHPPLARSLRKTET